MATESALVVLVPAAEPLVQPFRDRFDPSAAAGVAAHLTLLYPFKPPKQIDEEIVTRLRRCFARFSRFRFALSETRRFAGVLYLAPTPDAPFRAMTEAIWREFPETPPYAGRHPDIVPHLSIAQLSDEQALDRVAAEFSQPGRAALPIAAAVDAVTLLELADTRWRPRMTFPLAPTRDVTG